MMPIFEATVCMPESDAHLVAAVETKIVRALSSCWEVANAAISDLLVLSATAIWPQHYEQLSRLITATGLSALQKARSFGVVCLAYHASNLLEQLKILTSKTKDRPSC